MLSRNYLVPVVMMLSLCALAWADHDINDPYYAPHRPVTVDGDLSEWAGDRWIVVDEPLYGTTPDVVSARYAVRWNRELNVIYVALEVVDTEHVFGVADDPWNTRDEVEVSIDAADHDHRFLYEMGYGQQIIIDAAGTWVDATWEFPVGPDLVPQWASGPDGDTYRYEVALVPYAFYNVWGATDVDDLMGASSDNVVVPLVAGTTLGLDVVVGSKTATTFGELVNSNTAHKFDQGAALQTWILVCDDEALPGNTDGDDDVDLEDFANLKNSFGIASGATWRQGDFDCDGDVDLDDFVILKQNFGAHY